MATGRPAPAARNSILKGIKHTTLSLDRALHQSKSREPGSPATGRENEVNVTLKSALKEKKSFKYLTYSKECEK